MVIAWGPCRPGAESFRNVLGFFFFSFCYCKKKKKQPPGGMEKKRFKSLTAFPLGCVLETQHWKRKKTERLLVKRLQKSPAGLSDPQTPGSKKSSLLSWLHSLINIEANRVWWDFWVDLVRLSPGAHEGQGPSSNEPVGQWGGAGGLNNLVFYFHTALLPNFVHFYRRKTTNLENPKDKLINSKKILK